MSIIPPVRGKSWIYPVTQLCIVLGVLLAFSLKTQKQAVTEGVSTRSSALWAASRIIKDQNVQLQRELADIKVRYERLAKRQMTGSEEDNGKDYQRIVDEAKLFGGMVRAHGSGVVVVLRDSPKRNPSETGQAQIEGYIVHDADIRNVVNELFASGAEVISVNGQRIVGNSSIRCVGPVVLINSTQVAPPFVIKAIGKPDVLAKALELPGGVADELFLYDMIEVTKEKDIVVPAYSGSTRFTSALPVESTGN